MKRSKLPDLVAALGSNFVQRAPRENSTTQMGAKSALVVSPENIKIQFLAAKAVLPDNIKICQMLRAAKNVRKVFTEKTRSALQTTLLPVTNVLVDGYSVPKEQCGIHVTNNASSAQNVALWGLPWRWLHFALIMVEKV